MRKWNLTLLFALALAIAPGAVQADTLLTLSDGSTGASLGFFRQAGDSTHPATVNIPNQPYGNFLITTCPKTVGCSGLPARVFPTETPTLDKLSLADAIIQYKPPAGTTARGILHVNIQSTDYDPVQFNNRYYIGVNAAGLAYGSGASSFILSDTDTTHTLETGPTLTVTVSVPPFNPGSSSFLTQTNTTYYDCPFTFPGNPGQVVCHPLLQADIFLNFFRPGDSLKITQGSFDTILTNQSNGSPDQVQEELNRLAQLPIGDPPPPETVPEPNSLLLLALGVGGVALARRLHRA